MQAILVRMQIAVNPEDVTNAIEESNAKLAHEDRDTFQSSGRGPLLFILASRKFFEWRYKVQVLLRKFSLTV